MSELTVLGVVDGWTEFYVLDEGNSDHSYSFSVKESDNGVITSLEYIPTDNHFHGGFCLIFNYTFRIFVNEINKKVVDGNYISSCAKFVIGNVDKFISKE